MSLHVQELEGVFLPILLSFSYYSFSPTICLIVPRYTLPERTLKDQILLLYVAKLFVVLALGKISRNRDTVNWLIALKGACFQSHDFDCQVVFTVRFHILSHNALYMLSTLFKWSFLKRFDFFVVVVVVAAAVRKADIYREGATEKKILCLLDHSPQAATMPGNECPNGIPVDARNSATKPSCLALKWVLSLDYPTM